MTVQWYRLKRFSLRLSIAIAVVAVQVSLCFAAVLDDIDPLKSSPKRGFVSHKAAATWEDALISGNGSIGALVWSRPLDEMVTFSHERLFMPWYPSQPVVHMAPHLDKVRNMIENGEYSEAAEFVGTLAKREGYRGMRWTDPLIPAFDLNISMNPAGTVRDYARSVDFSTGVATVRWQDERGVIVRRLFVSRPDNVSVLSLRGDKEGAINCQIRLSTTKQDGDSEDAIDDEEKVEDDEDDTAEEEEYEEVFMSGVDDIIINADGNNLTYSSRFTRARPDSIAAYCGLSRVTAHGGSINSEGDTIYVKAADEVIVITGLDVVNDHEESTLDDLHQRLALLEPDFRGLLDRHAAIHSEVFDRTRLDLGGGTDHEQPSEELLRNSDFGNLNHALLEKQFDASRYAILSSSGELPPTLQGVWTGTWTPPWQSDYTHNGNVPSAISSVLMGNMPECMESYLGYMESLIPHFRENAQKLYGCRGIMVPSRTSSHGYNTHFDEQYIHLFWTAGAAWTSHFFYDYYLYTGDREFLRDRALPFMKEAALFYENFLTEGSEGKLQFNPSYSPENTPANSDSQACINATVEIALVKQLLSELVAACETLDNEKQNVRRWKRMLAKMPDYEINTDGAISEWTTPRLIDNHQHRHVSHLVGLFDGLPGEVARSQDVQDAFATVIENRMQPRRQEGGGVMSFGLVQLGTAAASLGQAKLAYETVDMLSDGYWKSNLVSTHNPDELFNVDICGGMPAVIIKMLVSSKPGSIHLLPALPDEWPSGRIEGVLCRGQIEVRSLRWNPSEVVVSLVSPIDQKVHLTVGTENKSIVVEEPSVEIESKPTPASDLSIRLPREREVTLRIKRVSNQLPR